VVEVGSSAEVSGSDLGSGSRIGTSLASLGDLDGDGTIELAVGQSPADTSAGGRCVRLLSIAPDGSVRRVRRGSVVGASDSGLGSRLAALGDVDGVTDLALSDWDETTARSSVWVALLDRSGTVHSAQRIPDHIGDFEGISLNGVGFARALGAPGDLDGDGVPELVVGCQNGFWVLFLDRTGAVEGVREVRPLSNLSTWFGRSVTCASTPLPGGRVGLVVGGRMPTSRAGALWMLSLDQAGAVAAW